MVTVKRTTQPSSVATVGCSAELESVAESRARCKAGVVVEPGWPLLRHGRACGREPRVPANKACAVTSVSIRLRCSSAHMSVGLSVRGR